MGQKQAQAYSIQTIIKLLRSYTEKGNLIKIPTNSLERLETAIKLLPEERRRKISIEKINLNAFLKAIDKELKQRKEKSPEGRKELVSSELEYQKRRIRDEAFQEIDRQYKKEDKTFAKLFGKKAEKKTRDVMKEATKSIVNTMLEPQKVIPSVKMKINAILTAHQSDVGRVWSSYLKKNWGKIREQVSGLPQITSVIGVSREKRRKIHRIFHKNTGLTYSKYA